MAYNCLFWLRGKVVHQRSNFKGNFFFLLQTVVRNFFFNLSHFYLIQPKGKTHLLFNFLCENTSGFRKGVIFSSLQGGNILLDYFKITIRHELQSSSTSEKYLFSVKGLFRGKDPVIHWVNAQFHTTGFPCSSVGKESACNAGDPGLISGLGGSPGEGNGNPLQYSCLENPHEQRSLAGYSPWACKSQTRLSN